MNDFTNPYKEDRKESHGEANQRLADRLVMALRYIGVQLTQEEWTRFRDWTAKWFGTFK